MNSENKKIDSLQAVRAFAAILVLLFHGTAIINRDLDYLYMNKFFSIGSMGVDLFFVLSGFIIFYTSKQESFNILKFLKKRFIRIYPIYWVVVALLIAQYFLSPTPEKSYKGDFEVIAASITLFPQELQVVGVAWTLTFEVIFYLFFAFTFSKSKKFFFISFIIWSIIILTTLSFNIKTPINFLNILFEPIILEFGFGCLLAFLYQKNKHFKYWRWAVAIGGIAIIFNCIFVYFTITKDAIEYGEGIYNKRVYLFGIPAAFIIFGLLYNTKPVSRLLVSLGDASYSLYLIHGTVIAGLTQLAGKLHLKNIFNNFTGVTFIFILTIIIGQLFYLFVEKPLLGYFRFIKNANAAKKLILLEKNPILITEVS